MRSHCLLRQHTLIPSPRGNRWGCSRVYARGSYRQNSNPGDVRLFQHRDHGLPRGGMFTRLLAMLTTTSPELQAYKSGYMDDTTALRASDFTHPNREEQGSWRIKAMRVWGLSPQSRNHQYAASILILTPITAIRSTVERTIATLKSWRFLRLAIPSRGHRAHHCPINVLCPSENPTKKIVDFSESSRQKDQMMQFLTIMQLLSYNLDCTFLN